MTPEERQAALNKYAPVRLVWGILKDKNETMEGRICESQEQIIEVRNLFSEYREFKLVEIKR